MFNINNINLFYVTYTNFFSIISIYIFFIVIIFGLLYSINKKDNNIFKLLNNIMFNLLLFFFILKIYITIYKIKNIYLLYNINMPYIITNFNFNNGLFSDIIIILALISGYICLNLLGNKNLIKNISNFIVFYLFIIAVIFMVYTTNLLILFLSFELIFLPTIYCIYNFGYSKKVDKSCKYLILWTLFGAFCVLISLGCLHNIYKSLDYNYLKICKFSNKQNYFIYMIIFIGFGVKIPLVPFQHWLLKVHVEAPTPFSIFLSGFLVKSAIYCFYIFNLLVQNDKFKIFILIWVIISLVLSSFGLFLQTDFKKLIAWATVQEMTLILFFLLVKSNYLNTTLYIFILLHGLLSSYMFYLVDILQRRFLTREILLMHGLSILMPKSTTYVWILLLLFTGFPLTAKFYVEWDFILTLLNSNHIVVLILLIFINFIAVISFCRILMLIMYGKPEQDLNFIELQKNEINFLNYILFTIILLTFVLYTF